MNGVAQPVTDPLVRHLRAIGTTATVVVQDPAFADRAVALLDDELRQVDETCSRFRSDSELEMIHQNAGHAVRVSTRLFHALETACDVASRTRGAVDPTIGNAIAALGYDRDIGEIAAADGPPAALQPVAGYGHIQLSRPQQTVRIPRGVRLDLGSTAKALAADQAAARLAADLGTGVLVSLGGDVAVAGPAPSEGWAVGIALESATPADQVDQVVAIRQGGLASSSTSVRRWMAGGREVHHIVDPRTGDCVEPYWSLVSAVGATCVDANAATTAAMVWGEAALDYLPSFGQAMRLVRHDGCVTYLNGWPEAVAS
jgi:thiamine biosynthesis lipoprotein